MIRALRFVLPLFAVLAVAACTTPYQPYSIGGGYEEKELESGIWRVSYRGNGWTSQETLQTYWLYRTAELAIEKGYDGFEVLSDVRFISDEPLDAGQPLLHHVRGGFIYVPMYGGGGNLPFIQADVRMVKAPVAANPPKVFEAAKLKATLEKFVKGEKCENGNVCPHVHHYLLPGTQPTT